MMHNLPESDWKILSRLKPLALDRLCQQILITSEDIIVRTTEGGYHSAYLELFKHIQANDKRLSSCFDDWKRAQALFILANWRREKLITDDEFAAFSLETRNAITPFLKGD